MAEIGSFCLLGSSWFSTFDLSAITRIGSNEENGMIMCDEHGVAMAFFFWIPHLSTKGFKVRYSYIDLFPCEMR